MTSLSTGKTYAYDANGNMTCRVEGGITYKQEYNIENLLSAVKKMNGTCTGGTVIEMTSFVYDGDGNLVEKIKPGGSKTIYVGGVYEVDKSSGGSVTRTVTYYPVGGATLAPGASAGVRINSTLYFVLKDHLGSASVVTDATSTAPNRAPPPNPSKQKCRTGILISDLGEAGRGSARRASRAAQERPEEFGQNQAWFTQTFGTFCVR